MAEEWHAPSASATPWDGSDDSSLTPAQRLVRGAHREAYERLHPGVGGDAEFLNGYERDACPLCRSPDLTRWGHDRNGVRRWRCRACGATFTPATGTIFEGHRLPVAAWSEFLLELFSYESLAGMTRQNRRSPTTLPYQLAKLFMVLRGIRDSVVLSGRVQADEMMYRVPAAGRDPSLAGRRAGGYSRNNTCIAIACEERDGGSSVFAALGRGKPSAARARAAYCPHLADGCTLVHDRENSHHAVVRERHLVSEAYDSRLVKSLPDGENPLARVNRLCFLLRLFLDGHTGFDRANLPGWLDLFSVMMNPPASKMEKAAMVLDRAMAFPNTLRYRDFYRRNPSSGD